MTSSTAAAIGGHARAVLRYLRRRGPKPYREIKSDLVDGEPGWWALELDEALGELLDAGLIEPRVDGVCTWR